MVVVLLPACPRGPPRCVCALRAHLPAYPGRAECRGAGARGPSLPAWVRARVPGREAVDVQGCGDGMGKRACASGPMQCLDKLAPPNPLARAMARARARARARGVIAQAPGEGVRGGRGAAAAALPVTGCKRHSPSHVNASNAKAITLWSQEHKTSSRPGTMVVLCVHHRCNESCSVAAGTGRATSLPV